MYDHNPLRDHRVCNRPQLRVTPAAYPTPSSYQRPPPELMGTKRQVSRATPDLRRDNNSVAHSLSKTEVDLL